MHTKLRRIAVTAILALSPIFVHAASPGELVKLPCAADRAPDDPCTAVYFFGGDGRRHAFPNEGTYFSWYANFGAVKTIAPEDMAAIPLGDNVTYRPGVRLVKFPSIDKVYAVANSRTLRWVTTESVALALAGQDWARRVDDIPDTFFADYVAGQDIVDPGSFAATAEMNAASTIDAALPESYRTMRVTTTRGDFDVQVMRLRKNRVSMATDVAAPTTDCADNCAAKALADYARDNAAVMGVHGSYFCPPDYSDCQGKTNTFNPPVFRTRDATMFQPFGLRVHKGPMLAYYSDGKYVFTRVAADSGSVSAMESHASAKLVAAISNYPSLMQDGIVVVDNDPLLEEIQKTKKSTRAGIGMDDTHLIVAIAKNATVPDLAAVFSALGAKDALNLDGGGSTALLYGGAYKAGPGRALPNAILFKAK